MSMYALEQLNFNIFDSLIFKISCECLLIAKKKRSDSLLNSDLHWCTGLVLILVQIKGHILIFKFEDLNQANHLEVLYEFFWIYESECDCSWYKLDGNVVRILVATSIYKSILNWVRMIRRSWISILLDRLCSELYEFPYE